MGMQEDFDRWSKTAKLGDAGYVGVDLEGMAVALYAADHGCSFQKAQRAVEGRFREKYLRMAQAAFDHLGYWPARPRGPRERDATNA